MPGLYRWHMAQHALAARRARYLRRQRVVFLVFGVSTAVFFLLLVR